jgi:hypothetical protein
MNRMNGCKQQKLEQSLTVTNKITGKISRKCVEDEDIRGRRNGDQVVVVRSLEVLLATVGNRHMQQNFVVLELFSYSRRIVIDCSEATYQSGFDLLPKMT